MMTLTPNSFDLNDTVEMGFLVSSTGQKGWITDARCQSAETVTALLEWLHENDPLATLVMLCDKAEQVLARAYDSDGSESGYPQSAREALSRIDVDTNGWPGWLLGWLDVEMSERIAEQSKKEDPWVNFVEVDTRRIRRDLVGACCERREAVA
jgi:hypothetical protein